MLQQDGASLSDLSSLTISLACGDVLRWRGALVTPDPNARTLQGVRADLRWAPAINAARPPGALSLDMTANEGEAAPFFNLNSSNKKTR